ncbi:alpha,alpha-trehalase [Melioribacteraceae bacterium 4301-Me]|uniref:alpha,alpha-trehalase n=1 Tax=Pyranulibacter aquaticus TaxID=3163344 RepID=UPI003599A4E4
MIIKCNINKTLSALLKQEDTDGDNKITIEDRGPKKFLLKTTEGRYLEICGTYYLSNLLQELMIQKESGAEIAQLNPDFIFEQPVDRISRLIKNFYWDGLTRTIDEKGLKKIIVDTKAASNEFFIYVPHNDTIAFNYYKKIVKKFTDTKISVIKLPPKITAEYARQIKTKPGILSLAFKNSPLRGRKEKLGKISGAPFVVPGGRFNEMYGWDSYFEVLGLINDGKLELARSMADNLIYELKHYGKILNANRSYYLTRSQPPFLTSLIKEVYDNLPKNKKNHDWLAECLEACIYEYKNIWMGKDRLTSTGLSRYYGNNIGIPPETEPTHFDAVLKPFAEKYNLSLQDFKKKYSENEIVVPKLDEYFIHDQAVRESGHDTSYRLDGIAADVVTVDLNSLLYKYEIDIAEIIKSEFDDNFLGESSSEWLSKARKRKILSTKYLWNERDGIFYDYNFVKKKQTGYVSATAFYPMWAGMATKVQVKKLITFALPLLEESGGVAASSKKSRGKITEERPQRQWDYPNGWPPHQILIWYGLKNYGYNKIAERLAYKWLYTILRNAVDYNGTIPEKYDVVSRSHKVFAEYGNVGTEFSYLTKEGFGWMNASFQIGLNFISEELRGKLNRLIPPEWIFMN